MRIMNTVRKQRSTAAVLAAASLLTGLISLLLSWVLPLPVWWSWASPGGHHHFAFGVLAWMGYVVPAVSVTLALFLVLVAGVGALSRKRTTA